MIIWIIVAIAFVGYRFYKSRSVAGVVPKLPVLGIFDPNMVAIALNLVTAVCGLFYLISFNSTGRFLTVAASVVSSALVVVSNYGVPQISRQAIRAPLQDWFARCMAGAEFPFLYFSLMFLGGYASQFGPILGLAEYVAVVILVRRAIWFLGTHASKSPVVSSNKVWLNTGNRLWLVLKARETTILELSAMFEVLIGFWMIVLIFSQARQLMSTFVYWTFLRIKYMAPRSRALHLGAWQQVDRMTKSVRVKIPVLEKPIQMGVKWFNQGI
jgi:hypothetical protein